MPVGSWPSRPGPGESATIALRVRPHLRLSGLGVAACCAARGVAAAAHGRRVRGAWGSDAFTMTHAVAPAGAPALRCPTAAATDAGPPRATGSGAACTLAATAATSAGFVAAGSQRRRRQLHGRCARGRVTVWESRGSSFQHADLHLPTSTKPPQVFNTEPTGQTGGFREDVDDGQGGFLNSATGAFLLLILAVCYGGNVPLLKIVETKTPLECTGPAILTLRFIMACFMIMPWVLTNLEKVIAVIAPGVELAFWLWFGYTLQIIGLEKTSATTASIAFAVVGVTVQALEVLIDRQPLRPVVGASSIGVFAGLALFSTAPGADSQVSLMKSAWQFFSRLCMPQPKPLPHEAIIGKVPGEALAVLGAMIFGVHVWRCNHIVSDAKGTETVAGKDFELAVSAVQLIAVMVFCLVTSTLDNPYPVKTQLAIIQKLPIAVWLQIAACGVLCTGLPSVLELFAFKVVSPAVASLLYCTIPLWGTLLGVFFLHEKLGPQAIAGGMLILLAALGPSVEELVFPRPSDKSPVET